MTGGGTRPGHPSSSWALSQANSSGAAHCEISWSGAHSSATSRALLCPAKDQSQHTHTCTAWLALWGLLPADPGCGKHHFFHIPSFNSSSLLPEYSHHPGLKLSCQLQSDTIPPKKLLTTKFVLVLTLSFRFKITSSPGLVCVYVAACPSIVCVGFP